jgi:hypothetical protein
MAAINQEQKNDRFMRENRELINENRNLINELLQGYQINTRIINQHHGPQIPDVEAPDAPGGGKKRSKKKNKRKTRKKRRKTHKF